MRQTDLPDTDWGAECPHLTIRNDPGSFLFGFGSEAQGLLLATVPFHWAYTQP